MDLKGWVRRSRTEKETQRFLTFSIPKRFLPKTIWKTTLIFRIFWSSKKWRKARKNQESEGTSVMTKETIRKERMASSAGSWIKSSARN